MATANDLAQHLRTLSPEKSAARLSFYHYLNYLAEANEPVASALVNRFFKRALSFEHWREHQVALFEEVYGLLEHFQQARGQALDLRGLVKSNDIQAIQVRSLHHVEAALHRYFERESASASDAAMKPNVRLIADNDVRVLALQLNPLRELTVTSYSRDMLIENGELVPLHSEFRLEYSSELNLVGGRRHQLDLGGNSSVVFGFTAKGVEGALLRGFTLQKTESLIGSRIEDLGAIFYPLKRVEQFFIDRRTDPVYQDLMASLEKALSMLESRHPEAKRYAKWAIERSRFAFEHIYSEDKLVRLISQLERLTSLSFANSEIEPATPLATNALGATAPARGGDRTQANARNEIKASQKQPAEDFGIDLVEAASMKSQQEEDSWPAIRNLPV